VNEIVKGIAVVPSDMPRKFRVPVFSSIDENSLENTV
jgi:hypothetical protein